MGHRSSKLNESRPLLSRSVDLDRCMTRDQLECLKLAAAHALSIPFEELSPMKSYAEITQLIRGKITVTNEIDYYIMKMVENQQQHELDLYVPPPSEVYPKFDMILTLGKMMISMEEADYKRFRKLIAREKLPNSINPGIIETRCRLIKHLFDEYPDFENDSHLDNVYKWLNECGCYEYQKYLVEYSKRHNFPIPKQSRALLLIMLE